MTPMKKRSRAITAVEGDEDGEPVPVVDTTLARVGWMNWDAMVKIVQILTPVLLAFIAYLTISNGNKAEKAQDTAESTRREMITADSSQAIVMDTIHAIVNSQRTALEEVNQTLREALTAGGLKQPPGTRAVPR